MRKFKLSSIMQYAASQHINRSGYRYATLLLLLLMAMGGATKAQTYYVFYSNGNFNSDVTGNSTSFIPNASLYSGTSGSTFGNANGYYFRYNNGLVRTNNVGNASNLTIYNDEYIYVYANRNYYWLYYYNSWSFSQWYQTRCVYSVNVSDVVTAQTISGDATISSTGTNSSYAVATNLSYYTKYEIANVDTYYGTNPANAASTQIPASPNTVTSGYTWRLSDNASAYATVNSSTGAITVNTRPTESDVVITLYCDYVLNGTTYTDDMQITLTQDTRTVVNPSTIVATDVSVFQGVSIAGTNYTLSVTDPTTNRPYDYVSATSANTSIATITNNSGSFTINGVAVGSTTVTIYAYETDNTTVACSTTFTVTVIEPTTGVDGTVVTINDIEDHTWSYYQDYNDLPTGYPTGYLNSPDPRNVIIDYRGVDLEGNLSANVAISGLTGENQNEMIYYKTLEKTVLGMTGDYPYTVISNPFSKRPKSGSTYYGFAGWKVKSGGEYIAEYSNNDVIPLDATIHFTNLNTNYSPNCISATVVLEATWTEATVKTGTSAQTFSGGTYETNFWLVNDNINSDVTVNSPCTVTMMSPDGGATVNNRGTYTISRSINPGTDHVKVEFVRMNHTNAVNINGYDYIIGRGVIGVNNSNTGGDIQGCSSNKECTHTFKIESGTYSSLHNFTSNINTNRIIDQLMILGCDYDRAKGDNSKLIIKGDMYGGYGIQLNRTSNDLYLRGVIKSGTFQSNVTVGGNGNYKGSGGTQSYYFSVASIHNAGRRFLTVEGGRLAGIAGGMDETNNQDTTARSFDLRVRGTAQIDGVVYGAAEYANGKGTRVMVFTGGTINGWIAGGANGTQESNGALWGSAYLYVGGKTQVVNDDDYPNQVMNRGVGGNVFGAGCGYSTTSTSGQVTLGTNVVVSDEAVVDRGVYGGGSFGYCTTNQTANVFILGGKVNGKDGGVNGTNYSSSIQGGVFGGACQNNGGEVNILMTDGTVMGGVYGGSNSSGTIAENAVVTVYGGTVGSQSDSANVHGGGLGSSTYITKNVTVTIGKDCDNGPMIYGDVHGGSAQGTVNGTEGSHAYTNNYTTSVSVAGGTMHDVFGGGLGTNLIAATVCGRVTVNVTGGIISNVFGGNNVNGQPLGSSIVTINYAEGCGTTSCGNSVNYAIKEAVYGGGRGAAYDYTGGTVVNFQSGSASAVYGGGLGANASVKKTSVTMTGGTVGNVFGGGNAGPVGTEGTAASVVSTTVSVLNGTVCNNVYGGGNAATVNGSTRVNIGEECISN